ncbi:MAG: acyl-CoA dehydrogenase family protein [Burkholderiales bacterium]
MFNKSGWRFYQNAELIFENARVPHENVVGEVNAGGRASRGDTSGGDLFGDLELCANALGVCDDAIDLAMGHGRTRVRAGKPLIEHPIVRLKLHEMHMLMEALRALVMRVASEHDRGASSAAAGLALTYASDVIQRVTRLNMEIHAANGSTMNARVEKLARDAVIWTHTAGDTVLRLKAFTRLM